MKSIRALAFVAPLVSCVPAVGQTTQGSVNTGATVIGVDVRVDGKFLATVSSPLVSQPACATNHVRITGDASTSGGKALLAAAMLAYSTKSPLALVQGTGSCDQYAGYESILILAAGSEGG